MKLNELKAGAFFSYVNNILNILVGLIYMPYMLRMMGKSEYGLYSLVASIVAYLTILDLGFGDAIIRYTAALRAKNKVKEQQEMFGMFFILYFIIGLVVLGLGLFLYFNIDTLFSESMTSYEIGRARIMVLLLCFNLAVTMPMSIWGAIVTAYEKFIFLRVVSIFRVVLNPLVMIIVLNLGYKAVAMVVVTTIFNIGTLIMHYWLCKFRLKIKLVFGVFNWSFLKEIFVFSFWVFLNSIMNRVYWSTGQFVLGIYKGTAAIAVYALAIQLQGMYMSFSTAISGVFLPKVTSMIAKGSSDKEISDLFIRTGRIQFIIMSCVLTGFIIFGSYFIRFWAGEDYIDTYTISLLLIIPFTVPHIQNMGITILSARNQLQFRCTVYIIIAACCFALSFPLAEKYGGIGCAISVALALIIGQIIIMNIYYHKVIHIDIISFWKEISKMSIVPIVLCITTKLLLQYVEITSFIDLGKWILVYCAGYIPLFALFSMNNYERDLLVKPVFRLLQSIKTKN